MMERPLPERVPDANANANANADDGDRVSRNRYLEPCS
jgi:hypothetical protein